MGGIQGLPARASRIAARTEMPCLRAVSVGRKLGMSALRPDLAVATILVIVKIIELAVGH